MGYDAAAWNDVENDPLDSSRLHSDLIVQQLDWHCDLEHGHQNDEAQSDHSAICSTHANNGDIISRWQIIIVKHFIRISQVLNDCHWIAYRDHVGNDVEKYDQFAGDPKPNQIGKGDVDGG